VSEPGQELFERHPSLDERIDPAVRIHAHDPHWAGRAEAEMRRIRGALGGLVIGLEHVGSTAVGGLAAKPVIDLQLAVAELGRRELVRTPLQVLGYLFVADPDSPDYDFYARPPERPRAYHLHVCQAGGRHELRHILVRDFLRAHPAEAGVYEALKRTLVKASPEDRLAYIAGKRRYMDDLERRALSWGSCRPVLETPA
jgi:GrpB-like predicted nucleotidyltransferase (UPF0157 family)